MTKALTSISTIGRILGFRFSAEDLQSAKEPTLLFGLVLTWLAGVGRYRHNPRVLLFQQAVLSSIAYVLCFSTFLWLVIYPLRPERWSFYTLLVFITSVSPPAYLYAIPVERFLALDDARSINFMFLGIVSLWRVALYGVFLWRYAELKGARWLIALVLPLAVIVFTVTSLNLEKAVFEIMAGNDSNPGTVADTAYAWMILFSLISLLAAPIVLFSYVVIIIRDHFKQG